MASSMAMLKVYKKDIGNEVGSVGGKQIVVDRVPTSLFAFDLATGGGFPRGCLSIVYGPESSGKTNLALKAIANHQVLWPAQQCVFIDLEHALDPDWATQLGVDMTRLIVMQPDYAEQAGDIIEGFLGADDCGLIVLDSVAAMMTAKMAEDSLEKASYGGPSVVMNRLCDKITRQIRDAQKTGRSPPTVIFVNQLRTKVGIVYGNPMTMPGGVKQKFSSMLTVRVTGKNILDNKVSKVLPVLKETQFVIEKWKVKITAINGMFQMVTHEHNGLKVGETADWNTVAGLLKSVGLLVKLDTSKGGWTMYGETYPTLAEAKARYYGDKVFGIGVRKGLIDAAIEKGATLTENHEDETDTQ